MNYKESIEYLYSTLPAFHRLGESAYKNNLDNTFWLDEYFGHPHLGYKTIHIAGTNGKGSVSHMLASVLTRAGYKTGLYTSPHLKDFQERIRIDGNMICEERVIDFVAENREMIERLKPSFFELTVAMAFHFFAEEMVGVAVIETGLGGRLDSTNIINPVLSVITNIGLDHTRFLGHTLADIAAEKAGIIKEGIPVVIGEKNNETKPVFDAIAQEKNSPLYYAEDFYQICEKRSVEDHAIYRVSHIKKSEESYYTLDLQGEYQKKNLITVLTALDTLKEKFDIRSAHINEGLKSVKDSTGLAGRWQVLNKTPLVIADTGHNEDGIRAVTAQIRETPHDKLYMVFGVVNDKDLARILPLLPRDAYYFFTQPQIERAMDAGKLYRIAKEFGLKGEMIRSVKKAYEAATGKARKADMVFIGGSTFTVAEVL